VYGRDEAHEVIRRSQQDYANYFGNLEADLSKSLLEEFNSGNRKK